jgi:hypothetical protein
MLGATSQGWKMILTMMVTVTMIRIWRMVALKMLIGKMQEQNMIVMILGLVVKMKLKVTKSLSLVIMLKSEI